MAKNYRKATHIMLDIETLDTKPSAAVMSVGMVVFMFTDEGYDILTSAVVFPSVREQVINLHRTMSEDTVNWWRRQEEEARNEVVVGPEVDVAKAIRMLASLVQSANPDYIWAQGASFDFPIMKSLADQVGLDLWPFWIERDCRTVLGLPEDGPVDRGAISTARNLTAHNAIDDCKIQILAMHQALFPQRA